MDCDPIEGIFTRGDQKLRGEKYPIVQTDQEKAKSSPAGFLRNGLLWAWPD
jgi:hypothetical protein